MLARSQFSHSHGVARWTRKYTTHCWRHQSPGEILTLVSVKRVIGMLSPSSLAKLALVCATLLSAGQFIRSACAEDNLPGGVPSPPNLIYPEGSEITFEWSYYRPRGTHCVFSCGPSTNVATYLTIYLGIAPIGHDQKALALFYFYSTPLIPRNNGFRISSGPTASFSCDVNGMVLDYSGPPKDIPGATPKEDYPTSSTRKR